MLWRAGVDILDGLEIGDAPLTLPAFISLPSFTSLQPAKLIPVLDLMPAVSAEEGRWRLTDQSRYGGGGRAGTGAGCEAGAIRGGQPAGASGSGEPGVGGPI